MLLVNLSAKGNEFLPQAQNYNSHIYMQPDVVDL